MVNYLVNLVDEASQMPRPNDGVFFFSTFFSTFWFKFLLL